MVGQEFFELVDRFGLAKTGELEDLADKLNSLFTVLILLILSMVVTIKSYVIKPIACYANIAPSGLNFDGYLENYCWVNIGENL